MSCQAVIVDTNVVVAGLLTVHDASPGLADLARILDGMLAAAFPLVVSESLLAECHAVLVRPGMRRLHGLTVAEGEAPLTDTAQHVIALAPVAAMSTPDSGDQLLLELPATRAVLLLLTGDIALQRNAGMQARVVSPQSFVVAR